MEQNFGVPFDTVTSERLTQVELSRRLSDAQILGSAMRSGPELDTGEAFLEVKNLGDHEKVLNEKCGTESRGP